MVMAMGTDMGMEVTRTSMMTILGLPPMLMDLMVDIFTLLMDLARLFMLTDMLLTVYTEFMEVMEDTDFTEVMVFMEDMQDTVDLMDTLAMVVTVDMAVIIDRIFRRVMHELALDFIAYQNLRKTLLNKQLYTFIKK